MHDLVHLTASHPLFRELRKSFLWHCTSVSEFEQIRRDAFIKPNDGRVQKWGSRLPACQQFDAISLFDFASQSEEKVLSAASRWHQFLACDTPLTIVLGVDRSRVTGKLVAYPENKDRQQSADALGPIPWVEVCHCGPIPMAAVSKYVVIFSGDYSLFRVHKDLTTDILANIQSELEPRLMAERQERKATNEAIASLNKQLKIEREARRKRTT
jgi:hypothetical protein